MTLVSADTTTARSAALFREAQRLLPGGVDSPVRAFRAVGLEPNVSCTMVPTRQVNSGMSPARIVLRKSM